MDVKTINQIHRGELSTVDEFDFAEQKKPSKIELKRQLILKAAENLPTMSDAMIRKLGIALAS